MLNVSNLTYSYGRGSLAQTVLSDVDFVVPPGEICTLTGPSGSGKTTLLSLCGALRQPQIGSLKIFDREMLHAGEHERMLTRRRIGFIFQQHNLLSYLTARDNIVIAADLAGTTGGDSAAVADRLLDRLGMLAHAKKFPAQLSGGQKQRVAIARALAGNPKLILADEPTASLDSVSSKAVMSLFNDLAQTEGKSILIVTHDALVIDQSTRIVRLEHGRLIGTLG